MLGMFTTEDASKILGLTESTLKTYRSRGDGPEFVKNGRKVFYERDAMIEWLVAERSAGPAMVNITEKLAEERNSDLAAWVAAQLADDEEEIKAEIERELAEAGATPEDDTGEEIVREIREQWYLSVEENILLDGEFNEKWDLREQQELKWQVEDDVDRAIDLLGK